MTLPLPQLVESDPLEGQEYEEVSLRSMTSQSSYPRQDMDKWRQSDICNVCDACLHETANECPGYRIPRQHYLNLRHIDGNRTFVHHRTLDSLELSIRGGCRFCINLWNVASNGRMGDQVEPIPDFEHEIAVIKRALNSNKSSSMLVTTRFSTEDVISAWTNLQAQPGKTERACVHSPRLDAMRKGSSLPTYNQHSIRVSLTPSPQLNGLRIEADARSFDLTTGSGLSMKALRQWVRNCEIRHVYCAVEQDWHPTRLIQLQANRPYCTLSYCWGGLSHRLLLTRESEQRLKAGASLDNLPKVLQDAAQVCAMLDVQYLWVDSLCIKQDHDMEDWKRESQLMHKVYSKGYLNISATASSSPDQGLFRRRRLQAQVRVRHETEHYQPGLHHIKSPEDALAIARQKLQETPLQQRAWVLQERLLAPRNAHFGPHEIFWECNTIFSSESCAHTSVKCASVPHDISKWESMLPRLRALSNNTGSQIELDIRNDWLHLLNYYSAMNISYLEDRPVAFAGIATVFATKLVDRYVYGFLAGSFHRELMWRPRNNETHERQSTQAQPAAEAIPSWSWLSTSLPHSNVYFEGARRRFSIVESEADLRALADCPSPPRVHLKGMMGLTKIRKEEWISFGQPGSELKVTIGDLEPEVRLDRPPASDETISPTPEGCECYYMIAQWCDMVDGNNDLDFFLFQSTRSVTEKGGKVFRRLAMVDEIYNDEYLAVLLQTLEGAGKIPSDSYDADSGEHVICVA